MMLTTDAFWVGALFGFVAAWLVMFGLGIWLMVRNPQPDDEEA